MNKNQIVAGDYFEYIDGNEAHTIHGDFDHVVGGGRMDTIDGPFYTSCHQHASETVDGHKQVWVGDNLDQYAKGQFNAQSGASMSFFAGEKLVLESIASVTLRVGGSYVHVSPAGVEIFGPEIKLNCGGGSAPSGEACAAVPGADAMEAVPEYASVADGAVTGYPSAPGAKIAHRPSGQTKPEKQGKGMRKNHVPRGPEPVDEPEPKGVLIPPSGGLGDPGAPIFYPDEPNDQPRIPASGGI
ncbi:MAG: hypothetical protein ACJ8C4_09455 [Gemmataceae bacterium]